MKIFKPIPNSGDEYQEVGQHCDEENMATEDGQPRDKQNLFKGTNKINGNRQTMEKQMEQSTGIPPIIIK